MTSVTFVAKEFHQKEIVADLQRSARAEISGTQELVAKAASVKAASRELARASTDAKNRALRRMAAAVRGRASDILAANARDCARALRAAQQAGDDPLLDRLTLTEARLETIARDIEAVAELPDPVGQEIERTIRPNGLVVTRLR